MARTVAKRSSEPLWARVLSCSRHFETMPYFVPRFMPPLRGSHLFLWPFPGVPPLTGLHRRAILYRPSGAQNSARLRLAITPSTSDLLHTQPHLNSPSFFSLTQLQRVFICVSYFSFFCAESSRSKYTDLNCLLANACFSGGNPKIVLNTAAIARWLAKA